MREEPVAEVTLEIPTETFYLASIRTITHAFARRAGFSERVADQIQLAVDEVCATATTREARPEQRVRLELGRDSRKLWARVSYRGGQVQPVTFDESGFDHAPLPEQPDMGHVILTSYMDEVDFAETEEGSEIRMIRFLRPRGGGPS